VEVFSKEFVISIDEHKARINVFQRLLCSCCFPVGVLGCLRVGVKGLVGGLVFTFVSVPERVCVGGYPKITWEAGKGSIFLIIMRVQMVGNATGIFKNKIQK
jgi:hypothetical protein